MSDEDAFQAALDARPDDHLTRRVFADWLQDRGDPRAEGYRVLGQLQKYPELSPSNGVMLWFFHKAILGVGVGTREKKHSGLTSAWFLAALEVLGDRGNGRYWIGYTTSRRELEDAVAVAFRPDHLSYADRCSLERSLATSKAQAAPSDTEVNHE